MTIERIRGRVSFTCDECGDEAVDTGLADFGEALQALRDAGWRVIKVADGYEHRCPGCCKSGGSE